MRLRKPKPMPLYKYPKNTTNPPAAVRKRASALRRLANKLANHIRRGYLYKVRGQSWREDTRGKCTRCKSGENGNATGQLGARRFVQTWFEPLTDRASHLGSIKRTDPICAPCVIRETEI